MVQAMSGSDEASALGKAAIKFGIFSVALAAIFEIGCLGYYGSGLSTEDSALSNLQSGAWSPDVKSRIQTLYLYYFLSLYICLLTASVVHADPYLCTVFGHPLMVVVDFVVQTIVQGGKAFMGLKSEGFLSPQKFGWMVYCMFVGAKASPAMSFGAEATRVAIHMTLIMILLLIALALNAPVDKFTSWKCVLNNCEIAIFLASIGSTIFPISNAVGAIFFSVNFYGGLILYPLNFLRHSQDALLVAGDDSGETTFCAVAMIVPMILDVISVFSRLVVLAPPV